MSNKPKLKFSKRLKTFETEQNSQKLAKLWKVHEEHNFIFNIKLSQSQYFATAETRLFFKSTFMKWVVSMRVFFWKKKKKCVFGVYLRCRCAWLVAWFRRYWYLLLYSFSYSSWNSVYFHVKNCNFILLPTSAIREQTKSVITST